MVKRHLAGLIVAAVIAGGGAAAFASAAPDGSSGGTPTATAGAGAQGQAGTDQQAPPAGRQGRRAKRPGPAMLGRAVHGDLIVRGKDGTFENVTLDKGVVESKGDQSLTIKRPDGKTVTIKVDGSTRYRGIDSFGSVQTGKPVVVVSRDGTALMVGQRAPGGNVANRSNVGGDEEQVPAT